MCAYGKALAALLLFTISTATAQITNYSNLTNNSGQAFSNGGAAVQGSDTITRLVADHIFATVGGFTTQWSFTVANQNTGEVEIQPLVRFYDDNGPSGSPGTLLAGFSFGRNTVIGGGFRIFTTTTTNFTIPADGSFWAGISFDNDNGGSGAMLADMNAIGQQLFNPPTIGSSDDTYFITNTAGSFLANNPAGTVTNFGGSPVANFGWQFQVVPEPGSMVLATMAAISAFCRIRRKSGYPWLQYVGRSVCSITTNSS